jgi:hypothetical protein
MCGAIRYTLYGAPVRVGVCHCTDCRKAGGSAFNYFGIWPRSSVETTGQRSQFGNRTFCPGCGSRIGSGDADEEIEILLGTLDEAPVDLVPDYELWIGRREGWLLNVATARQFDHDRD